VIKNNYLFNYKVSFFFQKWCLLLFFSGFYLNVFSQNQPKTPTLNYKIDSLYKLTEQSKENDSLKIERIIQFVSKNKYLKSVDTLIKKAIKIAKQRNSSYLIAHTYRMYGSYFFYNSKMDSAVHYLVAAKKEIADVNSPFLQAAIRTTLSGVYRKQGNLTKAISTSLASKAILDAVSLESLSPRERRKIIGEKLILHNALANFYNQLENYDKAILSYDEAYKNALLLNVKKYAGVILNNKADLMLNHEKTKEALKILLQAKKLKEEGKASEYSMANTYQNLGMAYMKIGDFNKATTSINKALDIFKKKEITAGIMEATAIKGNILFSQKKYKEAIENFNISKQIAFKNNDAQAKAKVCNYLFETYETIGNYKKALENHKLFVAAKDAVFNEKNIKKITQIEMQAGFERDKEIARIKSENQKKQSKSTIKLLVISVFALVFIAVLLFLLNSVKRKNNEKLIDKNKQISEALATNKVLFKETHHRVKNNLQIISSLLNMQQHFIDDEKIKKNVIESQNRIKSMSLIHQKLYQNKFITGIETKSYFSELIESLCTSYGINTKAITLKIAPLLIDVDTAIPMGLIINEIISNAFKHAFHQKNSALLFKLYISKDTHQNDAKAKEIIVIIKDNGKGIDANFNFKKSNSYGMKIIHSLAKKIKADILFVNDNGLEVKLIIKRFKIINTDGSKA